MPVIENPVIDYLDLQVYAATGGFILGRSRLGTDSLDDNAIYEWTSYAKNALDINFTRGAKNAGIKNEIEVGTLNARFYEAADPNLDPNIAPNVPVRILATVGEDAFTLITAKINDCRVIYSYDKASGETRRHGFISAVDAVSELGNIKRYGAGGLSEPYETWEARIERLSASSTIDTILPPAGTAETVYELGAYRIDYLGHENVPPPVIDFDGWERFGGINASLTETGSHAGGYQVNYDEWTPEGFTYALGYYTMIKTSGVSYPVTIPGETYGAKRLITGLTPGRTYTLRAEGAFRQYVDEGALVSGSGGHVDQYQLGVIGVGWGDPVDLRADFPNYTEFPEFEFVATSTSHEIAYRQLESVTRNFAGGGIHQFGMHRELIRNIRLEAAASASDLRLEAVVYESSLLNHYNLACDSIGAYWWVGRSGNVRFKKALGGEAIKATFSDKLEPIGSLHYVDVTTAYDTKNTANDITFNQNGIKEDPENPGNAIADNYSYSSTNQTSIRVWGHRAATIDTCIYDKETFAGSLAKVAKAFLAAFKRPQVHFDSIRYNAQDNIAAIVNLDIYDRIRIIKDDRDEIARILNITHNITPTRHIVTLEVRYESEA